METVPKGKSKVHVIRGGVCISYWLAFERPQDETMLYICVGKLLHSGADQLSGSDYSLVDYNRAGTACLIAYFQCVGLLLCCED